MQKVFTAEEKITERKLSAQFVSAFINPVMYIEIDPW